MSFPLVLAIRDCADRAFLDAAHVAGCPACLFGTRWRKLRYDAPPDVQGAPRVRMNDTEEEEHAMNAFFPYALPHASVTDAELLVTNRGAATAALFSSSSSSSMHPSSGGLADRNLPIGPLVLSHMPSRGGVCDSITLAATLTLFLPMDGMHARHLLGFIGDARSDGWRPLPEAASLRVRERLLIQAQPYAVTLLPPNDAGDAPNGMIPMVHEVASPLLTFTGPPAPLECTGMDYYCCGAVTPEASEDTDAMKKNPSLLSMERQVEDVALTIRVRYDASRSVLDLPPASIAGTPQRTAWKIAGLRIRLAFDSALFHNTAAAPGSMNEPTRGGSSSMRKSNQQVKRLRNGDSMPHIVNQPREAAKWFLPPRGPRVQAPPPPPLTPPSDGGSNPGGAVVVTFDESATRESALRRIGRGGVVEGDGEKIPSASTATTSATPEHVPSRSISRWISCIAALETEFPLIF